MGFISETGQFDDLRIGGASSNAFNEKPKPQAAMAPIAFMNMLFTSIYNPKYDLAGEMRKGGLPEKFIETTIEAVERRRQTLLGVESKLTTTSR